MNRLSLSLLALVALVALAKPAEASGRRNVAPVKVVKQVVNHGHFHNHNAFAVQKVIVAPVVAPFVTSALVVNPVQAFVSLTPTVVASAPVVFGGTPVNAVSAPPADVGLLREQNDLLRQQNAQLRLQLQAPRQ